jgi:hypothetical protein
MQIPLRTTAAFAIAVGFNCGAATALDRVGQATALVPNAAQEAPATPKAELKLSDPIFRDAALETNLEGALKVKFLDGSVLSMGPGSQAVVDEFTYSGAAATDVQVIKYTKGLFRFISGGVSKDKVRIETPSVTIGIRGTIVRTRVDANGETTVGVDSGMAFLTVRQSGQLLTIPAGQKITVGPQGGLGQMQGGPVDGCD